MSGLTPKDARPQRHAPRRAPRRRVRAQRQADWLTADDAGEDLLALDRALARPPRPTLHHERSRPSWRLPHRSSAPSHRAPATAVGGDPDDLATDWTRAVERLRQSDWPLILALTGALTLGLVMVYSASLPGEAGNAGYWLRRQALSAAIGLVALTITSRVDYHRWRSLAVPGLVMGIVLMGATLVIGRVAHGGQRWLGNGLVGFQPSELAKLLLIVFLAHWLTRLGPGVRSARRVLPIFGLALGGLGALTLAQRDMGTTIILCALAFAMLFAAGARLRHLAALGALGALVMTALALTTRYRRERLDAFLHPLPPGCDTRASYQVCQGLLTLGSGGWFGKGLGSSAQTVAFLPFPRTDSIFAALGGELGLVGCALTLGLLGVIMWRAFRIGRRAPDTFGALLACGIGAWLAVQTIVNVGSVVDAIPFTGVPLPFISFGGSALVCELAAVGLLLNIARQGAPLRRVPLLRADMAEQAALEEPEPLRARTPSRPNRTSRESAP